VMWFSKGAIAQSTMDFWVGTFGIFLLATLQIICFGWIWGIKNGADELDQGALIKIPRVFLFIMKYVAPLYLLGILIGFSWQNLPDELRNLTSQPVAVWTMAFIGAVLALLLVFLWMGEKRWRAAGLDIDDAQPGKEPGP
jgi:neurotransmitter:Na+ symporter, NSS family